MTGFEFEWEKTVRRAEVAELLRQIANGLDDGGEVELALDSGKLEVDVPDEVKLELEYEAGDEETELELELSWSHAGGTGREAGDAGSAEQPAVTAGEEAAAGE